MHKKLLAGLLPAAAWCCGAAAAWGATVELQAKYLANAREMAPGDEGFFFQHVNAQHYWCDEGGGRLMGPQGEMNFDAVVKKEPKYKCEKPMRCVASFVGQDYGFVLDSTDFPDKGYNLLYFDFNRNGDLTDDTVVDAVSIGGMIFGGGGRPRDFPPITVKLKADDQEYTYKFTVNAFCRWNDDYKYISISLQSATYRVGEIELDGKKHRIGLVDNNSNGRFDDEFKIDPNVTYGDNMIYPTPGDMLVTNLNQKNVWYMANYRPTCGDIRQPISKWANIDGKFYDIKVTPAGDKLTLTPYKGPMGKVTNPGAFYRALLYGDQGFIKISGLGDKPVDVPAGEWKLLDYTIDLTEAEKRNPENKSADAEEKKEEAKPEKKKGLLSFLGKMVGADSDGGSQINPWEYKATYLYAMATKDYPVVTVKDGETAELPFGPPLTTKAKVSYWQGERQVYLELAIKGSVGEIVQDLAIKGDRPKAPRFEIVDSKDKKIVSGKFEYG